MKVTPLTLFRSSEGVFRIAQYQNQDCVKVRDPVIFELLFAARVQKQRNVFSSVEQIDVTYRNSKNSTIAIVHNSTES